MVWQAGQSGNPRGRITGTGGREKLISDRLRVHLKRPWKGRDNPEEKTNADRIAEILVEAATNGEPWAIAQVFDRVEGRPTQTLAAETSDVGARRIIREIVHVTETQEQLEAKEDRHLLVDFHEIKTVNGNGHDHADSENKTVNGHGRRE